MASNERERRRHVVRRISRNPGGISDEDIGTRAADIFFDRVRRHPGGNKLLKRLSRDPVDKFGISQSVYERSRRLNRLPEEAYEFVCTMSSHLLAQDLAQAYIQSRPQRVYTASIFRQLGVRGEELGFVMKTIYELAVGNAQPRRRRISRRSL